MAYRIYISISLIVLHLLSLVWYYSHDIAWAVYNFGNASILFYGVPFLCIGSNMVLISWAIKPSLLEKEIIRIHGIFTVFFGTICMFHYTGIVEITYTGKLLLMCFSVLVIFVIILWSAYTHGLFKKK